MSLLKTQDLNVYYGDLQALTHIQIDVEPGELTTIVGANAAGKSTLMNTISGILRQRSGAISFEDQRIEQLHPHQRVAMGIIQIPEGRLLFPAMSVQENLELGAYSPKARTLRKQNLEKVYSLLPLLKERRGQRAGSLSGGEQQMCAIGRGLMALPRLLMLDEPSLGLAPIIVQEMFDTVQNINREGTTVLLVEQNVQFALEMAHRGFVLENGYITLEGRGTELLQNEHLKKAYLGI
ncbi:MAG TPA: ABC transporter ATP-binding protein [Thermodesulfobacteriota bacterium]|nr:ABC transporter ATP-binding protein [Thermodesulfobacteriota bacterium]